MDPQSPQGWSLLSMLSPQAGFWNYLSRMGGQQQQPNQGYGYLSPPVANMFNFSMPTQDPQDARGDPNNPNYDPRYDRRRQRQQWGQMGLNMLQGGGYGGTAAPPMDTSWLRGGR